MIILALVILIIVVMMASASNTRNANNIIDAVQDQAFSSYGETEIYDEHLGYLREESKISEKEQAERDKLNAETKDLITDEDWLNYHLSKGKTEDDPIIRSFRALAQWEIDKKTNPNAVLSDDAFIGKQKPLI